MTLLEPQREGVPVSRPSMAAEPFWDGCNRGELLFQRCTECGRAVFNPAPICRYCTSRSLEWQRSAGTGTIYSWTVAHRPMSPAFTTPYAPVIVELDEGYFMLSNLIGCDVADVRVGLRVEAVFRDVGQGRKLPYFRPVAD
jgi:uncharacterized OB-fold protein